MVAFARGFLSGMFPASGEELVWKPIQVDPTDHFAASYPSRYSIGFPVLVRGGLSSLRVSRGKSVRLKLKHAFSCHRSMLCHVRKLMLWNLQGRRSEISAGLRVSRAPCGCHRSGEDGQAAKRQTNKPKKLQWLVINLWLVWRVLGGRKELW